MTSCGIYSKLVPPKNKPETFSESRTPSVRALYIRRANSFMVSWRTYNAMGVNRLCWLSAFAMRERRTGGAGSSSTNQWPLQHHTEHRTQNPEPRTQNPSISRINLRMGADRQTRQIRLRISTHYSYPLPNDHEFARFGLVIRYAKVH